MQLWSETKILAAIRNKELFECQTECGSYNIKIQEYVPFVCTAIHAGHNITKRMEDICNLSASERRQEEDPFTEMFIESFPITLVANDSRYAYDLNRKPEDFIYSQAWGKKVWQRDLTAKEIKSAKARYLRYYRILGVILQKLESTFGSSLIIDLHSYNWKIRQYDEAPLFNIGTSQVNVKKWDREIKVLENQLLQIELPNIETTVARDLVFRGKGYQASFVRKEFPRSLIIPLEIKKVYMDEVSGEAYPLVVEKLQKGIHIAVIEAASFFAKKLKRNSLKPGDLLPHDLEPIVLKIDRALFKLSKNIEILNYVNPVNLQTQKKLFFSRKKYHPEFEYRQLKIDPYVFSEELYKLPVSEIQDPQIRDLYRSAVEACATKVNLLSHLGTNQFFYNSLRYYGKPGKADIDNAIFLLHAASIPGENGGSHKYNAQEAKPIFEKAIEDMGFACRVILSNRLIAYAMVDNSRKTLLINKKANFTRSQIEALIHHELGIHMLTTYNAMEQPLQMLRLGLPGNTYTQEGLAVLSEYLSGNLNQARLKQLSLRVLAVDMMAQGRDFPLVYNRLREISHLGREEAFNITARAFRGGGFTKDYLYLKGFRDLLALYRQRNLDALLIGKTGVDFLDTLESLIERNILRSPKFTPPAFKPGFAGSNPILDYVVSSIS